MRKTLIIYHYFPHYRMPVFRRLSQDPEIQFTFISGEEPDGEIRLISSEDAQKSGLEWRLVTNHWFYHRKFLWQQGVLHLVASIDYDDAIFLANPYILTSWLAMIIAKLRGKMVFQWGHFILRDDLQSLIKNAFYRMADGLLLYGNGAKDRLVAGGYSPDKLAVINNSLDYQNQIQVRSTLAPEMLLALRSKLFRHPRHPVLVFIGRLTKRKKIAMLITASASLHAAKCPVNILMIGDGSELGAIREMVSANGLSDYFVHIPGTYTEAEIAPLISLSDICVSPGDVGLMAMHAMVYGIPVISHDNPYRQMPEYEAIIPGQTGALYRYGDLDDLVRVIRSWIEEKLPEREAVQKACYAVVAGSYTPEIQARIIHDAILRWGKRGGSTDKNIL